MVFPKHKISIAELLIIVFVYACGFNMVIANFIYSMMHPEKTSMEVFMRSLNNFIWNF